MADVIGYVDADGATPPKAFHDLVKHIGEADCVIGSRWMPGSVLHVSRPVAASFAAACSMGSCKCFWHGIPRYSVGAKVMRRQAVERISFLPAHRRHGVASTALLTVAGEFQDPGSTHRVDRQDWFESETFRTSLVMFPVGSAGAF